MKESKLIEMQNRIGTLLAATTRLAQEMDYLKTMLFGHNQVLKKLSEYDDIINQLKEEANEQQEGNKADDGGSTTDTNLPSDSDQ